MKQEFISCKDCQSRSGSVLDSCSTEELSLLDNQKSCIHYKKGQVLFHENANPLGLFCINSGKIKIYKQGSDGKDVIIRLAKSGDILGYRAMMSNTAYNSTATVIDDAVICFIPKSAFFSVLRQNERLSQSVVQLLCQLLGQAEQSLVLQATKPVRERVAEALLLLKRTYENGESPFAIALSREDLASMVGTAAESVIRILKEFKDDGLIQTKGRKITLLNTNELLKISQLYD